MLRDPGGGGPTMQPVNSAIPALFKNPKPQPWHAPMVAPAPPRQAPAPAPPSRPPVTTSRPPVSSNSGGGSVNRSSGRVGNNSSGVISPTAAPAPPAASMPAPAPVAPNINQFLAGDTTYQTQLNEMKKAYGDYVANQRLQTGQYTTQYGTNVADLGKQKVIDQTATTDDYASRGLLNSGVYTKAYGDLSNDYANRQKALDTGKSDFIAQLAAAAQTYQNGQSTTTAKAKQDAINRRAAQYGV